jgi:hypothetical protein
MTNYESNFTAFSKLNITSPLKKEYIDPSLVSTYLNIWKKTYTSAGVIATELDEVLTGHENWKLTEENKNSVIEIETFPALYPKPTLEKASRELATAYKIRTSHLMKNPLLSAGLQCFVGEIDDPKYAVIQTRGKGTDQGIGIQWSSAGFCKYGEHPAVTATREYTEEASGFIPKTDVQLLTLNEDHELIVGGKTPADLIIHQVGRKRTNPCLIFAGMTNAENVKNLRIVKHHNEITDDSEGEVAGFYLVPFDDVTQLFEEAKKKDMVFSDSCASVERIVNLINHYEK